MLKPVVPPLQRHGKRVERPAVAPLARLVARARIVTRVRSLGKQRAADQRPAGADAEREPVVSPRLQQPPRVVEDDPIPGQSLAVHGDLLVSRHPSRDVHRSNHRRLRVSARLGCIELDIALGRAAVGPHERIEIADLDRVARRGHKVVGGLWRGRIGPISARRGTRRSRPGDRQAVVMQDLAALAVDPPGQVHAPSAALGGVAPRAVDELQILARRLPEALERSRPHHSARIASRRGGDPVAQVLPGAVGKAVEHHPVHPPAFEIQRVIAEVESIREQREPRRSGCDILHRGIDVRPDRRSARSTVAVLVELQSRLANERVREHLTLEAEQPVDLVRSQVQIVGGLDAHDRQPAHVRELPVGRRRGRRRDRSVVPQALAVVGDAVIVAVDERAAGGLAGVRDSVVVAVRGQHRHDARATGHQAVCVTHGHLDLRVPERERLVQRARELDARHAAGSRVDRCGVELARGGDERNAHTTGVDEQVPAHRPRTNDDRDRPALRRVHAAVGDAAVVTHPDPGRGRSVDIHRNRVREQSGSVDRRRRFEQAGIRDLIDDVLQRLLA